MLLALSRLFKLDVVFVRQDGGQSIQWARIPISIPRERHISVHGRGPNPHRRLEGGTTLRSTDHKLTLPKTGSTAAALTQKSSSHTYA